MVQKGDSCRNWAEFSSWAEAELFEHPPSGLCPKLRSLLLLLQHLQQCLPPGDHIPQPRDRGAFGGRTH